MDQALRNRLSFQQLRRTVAVAAIVAPAALAPELISAENLLDFLFGGGQKHQSQPPLFGNIFNNIESEPSRPAVASSGPAFCVRSCDGKYFPLMRGAASPTQMCQAFCRQADQNLLRLQHRQRLCRNRRTLRRQRKRLRLSKSAAPRYATAAVRPAWRQSISRSTSRCARATWSPLVAGSSSNPVCRPAMTRTGFQR